MSSSTFNFKVGLLAWVTILTGAVLFTEIYARTSSRFVSGQQAIIKILTFVDTTQAAFGDSQFGRPAHLDGFIFFGPAGLQPQEMNRIVRYTYSHQAPKKIIMEMAPQWFGEYHAERPESYTDDALPPVKLLIASSYFYRPLAGALWADVQMTVQAAVQTAEASELQKPDDQTVTALAREWEARVSEAGIADFFEWSSFPAEGRAKLTLARAFEQNPREGFTSSDAAVSLASGVDYLIGRGAEVCLVELPITSDLTSYQMAIPGSRYAAFDAYAQAFADSRSLRWVRPETLPIKLDDSHFSNQDHLNAAGHALVWPMIEQSCFG